MNKSEMTAAEWLEADGLGGFASGTASGIRTRRYHALLLTARTPPTGRMVLVNGFDAWIETKNGKFMLSSQCYAPGVVGGDGGERIKSFATEPWPTWRFRFEDGTEIEQEIVAAHGCPSVVLTWKLLSGSNGVRLFVRPFLSGRDYHSLHRENDAFRFEPDTRGDQLIWGPYPGVPQIVSCSNGSYYHDPHWYRNFLYAEEQARGLDHIEDLASPGILTFELDKEEAVWLLSTEETSSEFEQHCSPSVGRAHAIRANERLRRQSFASRLHKAADSYIVTGTRGKTIIAGYPWFTDWGRDTFIALRGLCIAGGRLAEAGEILAAWAGTVSEGMLPNRFPDQGQQPEYNSADASLWFVIAAYEFLQKSREQHVHLNGQKSKLESGINAVLEGYRAGTRFGIGVDVEGLLSAGVPGTQLTWMDAKVGDWVVTPRIGKPVELQALWLNALWIGSQFDSRWKKLFDKGRNAFQCRFWNDERKMLFDVVDVDHTPGAVDPTFRPNQIFAIGGLLLNLLEPEQTQAVVDQIEAHLLTPLGLRSLAPNEPGYVRCYEGGVSQRDGCYHQGTVWPWLIGAFVEAWLRVHGDSAANRAEARRKFIDPLKAHLDNAGIGHISEIADAESPHVPRGCPFQAWSVGELLRIETLLRSEPKSRTSVHTTERPRRLSPRHRSVRLEAARTEKQRPVISKP
jgi:predicted glycogen debranching enzyme